MTRLRHSEWRRLILCEWAERDEALTSPEDVQACIRAGHGTLPPRPGISYTAALDVGTRRDLAALVVGHTEHRTNARVTVIGRGHVLATQGRRRGPPRPRRGGAGDPQLCREYGVTRLRFDRMQAEQLTTNLARAGVRTDEFLFTASGANRLTRALHGALRDRTLELPDEEETRTVFLSTHLVETGPSRSSCRTLPAPTTTS